MATEDNSNNGSNPSTGGSGDLENTLRQSPWGRLINEVASAGEVLTGFVTATGGGEGSGSPTGAGTSGDSPYGGNPFGGFGPGSSSVFTGGTDPWAAIPGRGGSSMSGGGAPTGDSTGGFGGAPTDGSSMSGGGAPTGGSTGGFGGAPTDGSSDIDLGGAFGGATSEIEIRSYIDNLVNSNLEEGGITPSFNVPESGEGTSPSPESGGGSGISDPFADGGTFGIPDGSFDFEGYDIPTDETLGNFGIPPAGDGDQTDSTQAGEYVYNFDDVDSYGASYGGGQASGGSGFDVSSLSDGGTDGGSNPFAGGSNPFAGGGGFGGFGA